MRPLPTQLFPGQALQISAPQGTLPLPLSFTAPCSSPVECSTSGSLLSLAPKSRGFCSSFFTTVEILLPSKACSLPEKLSSTTSYPNLELPLPPCSKNRYLKRRYPKKDTSVLSKLICYLSIMFCDCHLFFICTDNHLDSFLTS